MDSSLQNKSAETEPKCRELNQGKLNENGRERKVRDHGDWVRGKGGEGGVRNDSGFRVESLELRAMLLKEKGTQEEGQV